MRSTAIVQTDGKNPTVGYMRGHGALLVANDEAGFRAKMLALLKRWGEHPWETRDRWRYIDHEFYPWKPDRE